MTRFASYDLLYAGVLMGVLLIGAIWDIRKRIIPNTIPLCVLALAAGAFFLPKDSIWNLPLSAKLSGLVVPATVYLLLHIYNKPVGGGDLKLSAALGFLFGLTQFAFIYAVSGLCALVWMLSSKQKSVPLAIFLWIGVITCLLLQG